MTDGTVAILVTGVLSVLGVVGVLAIVLKFGKAIKESLDVVASAVNAIQDGQVSADEIAELKKQLAEAKQAWKDTKTK